MNEKVPLFKVQIGDTYAQAHPNERDDWNLVKDLIDSLFDTQEKLKKQREEAEQPE